jgi:3-oxoadipate enol-lactonase
MSENPSLSGPLSYTVRGSGPAVVLLHAFPLNGEMWRAQAAALEEQYRVLAPDLPGFGGSPHPPAVPDMDYYAEQVRDTLDRLELEQVVLGGLSMGGYVAFACMRLFPERVSALVLANTHAAPDSEEVRENRTRLIRAVAEGGLDALVEAQMPRLLSERTLNEEPETVAFVEEMIRSGSPAGAVAALSAMRERPDSTPLLDQITVPALVIGGELDPITTPEVTGALAASLPDARHAVISGVSHLSNLEAPERFNALLKGFLRGV